MATLHYHPSLMRDPAAKPCTLRIICTSCLHMLSYGAQHYGHHLTKLMSLWNWSASLGSCLDTFHSIQSNAGQQTEPEWDKTFWDFTSASIKQHCNWQLGYSFCAATLENVRRSQEVKSLWSRPANLPEQGSATRLPFAVIHVCIHPSIIFTLIRVYASVY